MGRSGCTGAQGSGAGGCAGDSRELRGATGLQGPMGSQGVPGPVGITFQGPYQSTTNYALADGVSYKGAGYVSLVASNHGNTPDQSPAQWALFAAAGATGATGPVGALGATGATGAMGPQGLVGTTGATGAIGAQGPSVANYLGSYQSGVNYALHDAVSWQGSTYVSLVDGNHGNTPDQSPSFWAVLAAQGMAGATGAMGAAGPMGATGATGAMGATGGQGPPVTFDGSWMMGTQYGVGEAVSYGGSAFVALQANAGRQPDVSPQYWGLLAAAGATGATGATGVTGLQGPMGFAGPVGAAGATGATGPAGVAGAQGAPVNFLGAYGPTVGYGVGDAVSWQGSSYISLVAGNHGNTPDQSPAQWGLLAAQGLAGAPGAVGAAGATGPLGAMGSAGPVGAIGATGAAGINFRGAWVAGTGYAVNDAVTFNGATYLAQVSNSSSEPDLFPQVWAVLAAAGVSWALGRGGSCRDDCDRHGDDGGRGDAGFGDEFGHGECDGFELHDSAGAAGAAGSGGSGGGGVSGIPFASLYHAVSFNNMYYSVNNTNASSVSSEGASVLTWVPVGCTATELTVFSQQANTITVTLRAGTPGNMADTALACSVASGGSCTATGDFAVAAGNFVDLSVSGPDGTDSAVWKSVACNKTR